MHFPARAASILFLSTLGHKIGVLKSPAFFQGKELQVTRFKIIYFWSQYIMYTCRDFVENSVFIIVFSYMIGFQRMSAQKAKYSRRFLSGNKLNFWNLAIIGFLGTYR